MRKAGEIVSAIFRDRFGYDFMETARLSADLFSSWASVTSEVWPRTFDGDQNENDLPSAAVHSRIRELERGILLVEADHPGWVQILQTKQTELLAAVQSRCPLLDIRAIAFKLSRDPVSPNTEFTRSESSSRQTPDLEQLSCENEDTDPLFERGLPQDEEFFTALKSLEKTLKSRNRYN